MKGAGDYVTGADRDSEAAIVEVLTREAPGIALLAEEPGGTRSGTMWVVVQKTAQLARASRAGA